MPRSAKKLVGIGTDGASSNMAPGGLKRLVEKELPWIFWMWCLAHRLELSVKDALRSTFFDQIDEMLLHLYYIYEKSPKMQSWKTSLVSLRNVLNLMMKASDQFKRVDQDG